MSVVYSAHLMEANVVYWLFFVRASFFASTYSPYQLAFLWDWNVSKISSAQFPSNIQNVAYISINNISHFLRNAITWSKTAKRKFLFRPMEYLNMYLIHLFIVMAYIHFFVNIAFIFSQRDCGFKSRLVTSFWWFQLKKMQENSFFLVSKQLNTYTGKKSLVLPY